MREATRRAVEVSERTGEGGVLLSRFCGTFLVFVGLIEKHGTD
eukprot:SAG31_NODE_13855_length_842_cov_1.044415_2_plen_42_part_01